MRWRRRSVALLFLVAGTATSVLANYSSSFKEVAARGGSIVLMRCSAAQAGSIVCKPLEAWRGDQPAAPLVIAVDDWAADPVSGLEKDSEARFLVIVGDDAQIGCLVNPPILGLKLPILGDRGTCIIPIIKGVLPAQFRQSYDHTDGPGLSLGELKKDLLVKSGPKAGA